jgi:hypothetical protein
MTMLLATGYFTIFRKMLIPATPKADKPGIFTRIKNFFKGK